MIWFNGEITPLAPTLVIGKIHSVSGQKEVVCRWNGSDFVRAGQELFVIEWRPFSMDNDSLFAFCLQLIAEKHSPNLSTEKRMDAAYKLMEDLVIE